MLKETRKTIAEVSEELQMGHCLLKIGNHVVDFRALAKECGLLEDANGGFALLKNFLTKTGILTGQ